MDEDLAGLLDVEDTFDPVSVKKSRSGHVIKFGDVPELWGSSLQREISFAREDFIAASAVMRQLLLIGEMIESSLSKNYLF